ncbi:MBG domain-containing protein [Amedibacillus sp. YH-ame10]
MFKNYKKKNVLYKGIKCILALSVFTSGLSISVLNSDIKAQDYKKVYQGVQSNPIVLNDGVYLFDNVTVKGNNSQPSAVVVEGKVTIVMQGNNNVIGYDARWVGETQYASGAGFQVEKQGSYVSELILRGDKNTSLYVKGGNANTGENGENGGDGYENRSPGGGRGGKGGNGASAAIGGRGGTFESPQGKDSGNIAILGGFNLKTEAGKGGAGGKGGDGGRSDGDYKFIYVSISAGGGGGGGGGGGFPAVDIGGGGAAGDQGGRGGSGSGVKTTTLSAFGKEPGAGGGGGRGWGAGGGGGTGFFAYYLGQPKYSGIRPKGGKGGTDPYHYGEGGEVGIMEATLPGGGHDAGSYILRVGSYSGDVVSVDDAEAQRNGSYLHTTRTAASEVTQRRHGYKFAGASATSCNEYSMWGGYGSDCAWAFIKQGGGETPEAQSGHGLGRRYELWIQNGGAMDGGKGENSKAGKGPGKIDISENVTWPGGDTGNGGGDDKNPGTVKPIIRTVIDLSHPDTKITFSPTKGIYTGAAVNPQISIVSSTGIKVDPNAYDVYTQGDLLGPGTVKYRFVGKGESYESQWVENETTRDYTIDKGDMNAYLIESQDFYTRRLKETFDVEVVNYKNDNNTVTWSVEPDPSTPDVKFTTTQNNKPGISITSTDNIGKIIVKATISEGDHYKAITTPPITLEVVPQGANLFTISKIPDQRYTGSEIKPTFTVNFGDQLLENEKDYTFRYEENIEVGRAKVIVTGIGNYTGTFTSYFNIVPADISPIIFKNANYSTNPPTLANLQYTSYPQISQPLEGVLGDKLLVEGKDYLVSYSNMTEVGKVVATVVGIGNYTNSTTLEYEILPADIDDIPGLMINNPENIIYDGTEKQQKPTVMLNGKILKEGDDYTLSYKDNIKAGTATVTITGKGNFTQSSQLTTNFEILQRVIYVVPDNNQWKYSGDNEPGYTYQLDNVVEGDTISMIDGSTITREEGEGVGEYRFLMGELGLDYGKDDNDNYILQMSPDVVNFKVKSFDTDEVAIIRGEIINKETGERAVVNPDTGWYNNVVEVVAPKGYLISRSPDKDPEGTTDEASFWQPYFSSEDGDFSKDGEGMTYYLMKIPEKAGDKKLISQAKQVNYKQDTVAPSSRVEMNQKKIYTDYKKGVKFETYFKEDVDLEIVSNDVTSGILSNDYLLADKEYTKEELDHVGSWVSKAEAEYQLTLDTEMKKILYLRAKDIAGNVTYVNTDGFIIDKTAPFIEIDYDKDGIWVTGDDATVKVKVKEDLSGVDERYVDYHYEYIDSRVGDPHIIKLDQDGNATITGLPDGNYQLVVTAKDKAGNSYSDKTHVMIDTIQPTLELKGDITSYQSSKDIDILASVGPSLVNKVYVQKQNFGDPCDESGTWTEITNDYNNNNHKYNVDENGTYYVKYVNGAGVESNIATISFDTIDKTTPMVDVRAITVSDDQPYTSETWTKDNVKVFFKNTASNLGNTKYSYRIKKATDVEWSSWQSVTKKNDYEASILLSQNGKFNIEMKITSESGMESTIQQFIVTIDKQLPTGTISLVDKTWKDFLTNPVFENFYNTDQKYIITPSDELSGVSSVQYILLKDEEAKTKYTIDTIEDLATTKGGWTLGSPSDALSNKVEVSISSDATYVLYVKVSDNVGNVRYISSDGAIVDATKPTLSIDKSVMQEFHYPNPNTKWIIDPFAILPTTLTDSLSGQDKLILNYEDQGTPVTKEVDIRTGNYDIGELPEGIYDLIVDGYDKAGNKASETVAIKKDTITPDVTLTGDTINLGKKKHVDLEPVVGTSGLKKVEYQYVAQGDTYDENGSWSDITGTYGDGLGVVQNGTLYVRVENNLGITNIKELTFGNIQEVPVELVVDTIDEDGHLAVKNGDWYPAINVRFYNNPRLVSDLVYEYHTGDGQWKTVDANTDGYAFIQAPEGETTYTVRITNPETGVNKSETLTVKVDTTKPTGKLTTTATNSRTWLDATNTTTINYGLPDAVDVVLKDVEDALNSSGLKSVEYYVMTAGKNKQLTTFPKNLAEVKEQLLNKWIACDEKQIQTLKNGTPVVLGTLNADQEYIVFVRIKDIAGNVQYITSDGITIDATKPVIKTDYVEETWLTDNEKVVQVEVKDNLSGVKDGTYTIANDATSNTYNYTCQNREGKFSIPVSRLEEGASTVTINATDVAGNVAGTYTISILKDTIKPVISIASANSTTHQVGIKVDEIGKSNIKEVYVTCDNGAFEKMDITEYYGEGIQITRNGTYTYVLVNHAGVSSAPVSITVDDMGEIPVVRVEGITGLGNAYKEGTWSNSEVSMHVLVDTIQIGKSVYEYSLDGKTWETIEANDQGEYWITQQQNGEFNYQFRVTAADGARSDVVKYKVKIDTSIPEFTYEITPNEYTNQWVDIIIHPNKESETLSYSFDGGETFSKSKEKRFISNGYVDLVVKNETGTTSKQTAQIVNIDRLSPLMMVYENQITDKNTYRIELDVKDAPENLDFIETGVSQVFITNENPYSENDVRTKPTESDYILEKMDNQHYVTKGEFEAKSNANETDNYWIIATDNVGNYKIKSFRVSPENGKVEETPDPEEPNKPVNPDKPNVGDPDSPQKPTPPNEGEIGGVVDTPNKDGSTSDVFDEVENIENAISKSEQEDAGNLLIKRQEKLDEAIEQLLRNLPENKAERRKVLEDMLELNLTNQQRQSILNQLESLKGNENIYIWIWIPMVVIAILSWILYEYKKKRLENLYEETSELEQSN